MDQKQTTISLYPNPVSDVLYVDITSPLIGTYSIISANGKQVQQGDFESGEQQLILDVKRLPSGVYWMTLQTDYERILRKVVIR